jgi:hypothetical protein
VHETPNQLQRSDSKDLIQEYSNVIKLDLDLHRTSLKFVSAQTNNNSEKILKSMQITTTPKKAEGKTNLHASDVKSKQIETKINQN